MTEKKVVATTKKVSAPKKVATPKKTVAKKVEVVVNSETAGFRAGDVYQTLAAAGKALSLAEISKIAKISTEETFLGIGWLMKEGKVKGENNLITLA